MEDRGDEEAAEAAIEAVRRAYAVAVAVLHAMADPERDFARTTELVDLLGKLVIDARDERAIAAKRIQEAESLTLAALGKRISMTRQRAAQLVDKAGKARGSDDG